MQALFLFSLQTCLQQQQFTTCCVSIFILHKNTVMNFIHFHCCLKTTYILMLFCPQYKAFSNYSHAKTISGKLTPLICTSLILICSLLFYRLEPIRAPFIQESFESLLYSPVLSLLSLISMFITLFFKLKGLPHIFIFKILSFLEREAYNP